MRASVTLLAAALGATAVSAIDTITTKGRHFVTSKGDPFFIRGIDYQPGGADKVKTGEDPLSDPERCARDIWNFQQLGLNTIRVYSIDPYIDHDECMSILAAAGMYLILDVNTPLEGQHIYSAEPWTTYTPAYLQHIFTVMEVFSGYDNTMSFIAGNEIIFQNVTAEVAPRYVKAVVRDMKQYMKNHLDRQIPVGYASADVLEYRHSVPDYLGCGPEDEAIDWFGVNSYQWCGHAGYEGSGYDGLVKDYTNYPLPLFFTEFGCNNIRPRVFDEVLSLYSSNMTGVFSGGCLYEYSQEPDDYGIVNIKGDGTAEQLAEFNTLRNQYSKAPKPSIPSGGTQPKRNTECTGDFPNINANTSLPDTLGAKFIKSGVPSEGKTAWKKGALKSSGSVTLQSKYAVDDASGNKIKDTKIEVTDGTAETATYTNQVSSNDTSSGGKGGNATKKSVGSRTAGGSNGGVFVGACTAAMLVVASLML